MSDCISLNEYLALFEKKAYFPSLPERLFIANEFLRVYGDICNKIQEKPDKKKRYTPPFTALLDLETVYLKKREKSEEDADDRYEVVLPDDGMLDSSDEYANFAYGAPKLFWHYNILGKSDHSAKLSDVKKRYEDRFAVYTVSRILFNIVFGTHPFKGREYYNGAVSSKDGERKFFDGKPKFIFEDGENSNRFVNGYHENARRLWSLIEDEHRNFFRRMWAGEYDVNSLIDDWHRIFIFDVSEVKTPCGEKLPALLLNKKFFLLFTETEMTRNLKLYCQYCKDSLTEHCADCEFPKEQRCTQPLTLSAKFVSVTEDEKTGDKVTRESPLLLFPKQKITTEDFAVLGMADQPFINGTVFVVAASKKYDKLGLKYIQESKLYAECGEEHAYYGKDNVIALFPGINIYLSKTHRLVVPGTPPVFNKKPVEKQTEKAQEHKREEKPASSPQGNPEETLREQTNRLKDNGDKTE